MDTTSRRWTERLRPGHPRREQAVASLHGFALRVARHELARRRGQLSSISGPEFDDVAHQAADDAVVNILRRIADFQGTSQFTTWAYRFVIFEVSSKVAGHAWRRQPPSAEDPALERLPDVRASRPGDQLELREQLQTLSVAIDRLSQRQREVFVAVALQEVSTDSLAAELQTNRNAIYKNLFDAKRNLRATMAAAGHPVSIHEG